MKILLIAVNAKYIHSNPAVYSLKAYADAYGKSGTGAILKTGGLPEIEIAEFTVNQQTDEILSAIYQKKPDVAAFSCYIWNLETLEKLIRSLPLILPKTKIWLGGPEVSYNAQEFLETHPSAAGIMTGEGEATFAELAYGVPKERIQGIAYRDEDGTIRQTPGRRLLAMDDLPFLYENMQAFENRIVYYESSRGCPFSCSYCLSSIEKTVRFRSTEKVTRELQYFLDRKVPQVKFVDRTFNCRHSHALTIWNYIREHDNGVTNFHFEIAADLLNEEELALLNSLRPGLIQLEIGVQSTNNRTLAEIHRISDFTHLSEIVERLRESRNIHLHLDLIAGLPFEDQESFQRSFNDVYALHPDQLQLGFLKVLKGSDMHKKAEGYQILYHPQPVYEVFSTQWISYEEILKLKAVENMVEIYYNSGQFSNTVQKMEELFSDPFAMYLELARFYEGSKAESKQYSRIMRLSILREFIARYANVRSYEDWMLLDLYLRENSKSRPDWAPDLSARKEETLAFYRREEKQPRFLAGYEGRDARQLMKMTHLECFSHMSGKDNKETWLLFDYSRRDPLSGNAMVTDVTAAMKW